MNNLICIPIYLIIAFLLAVVVWSVHQHEIELQNEITLNTKVTATNSDLDQTHTLPQSQEA